MEVWFHVFLSSTLAGNEWLTSFPCRFKPRAWVGHRTRLDTVEKGNISIPAGNRTLHPQPSLVIIPAEIQGVQLKAEPTRSVHQQCVFYREFYFYRVTLLPRPGGIVAA
jgi:hypothetical protein